MPRKYITTTPETRFWRHVNKDGPIPLLHPELGNCYLWIGSLDPPGYGHFWDGVSLTYAHRFAYGPVANGLEVSHLCEVEGCVRRSHLTAITHRANVHYGNGVMAQRARQTHCLRGHPFDATNTIWDTWQGRRHPRRVCRICLATRLLKKKQATS